MVQGTKSTGSTTLSIQDLVQGYLQRSLQSAALAPLGDQASGLTAFAQETTASLLASLTAPQATASTSPVADTTVNPTGVQPVDATAASTPSASPAPAVISDVPAAQDAFATSTNPDFAMQTALRFGAGVVAYATPALTAPDLGAGLVRDAASVQRPGSLQARDGGPGPDAFTRAQASLHRVLRTYETSPTSPATPGGSQVDLFA
jgi:hypothetical protein